MEAGSCSSFIVTIGEGCECFRIQEPDPIVTAAADQQ